MVRKLACLLLAAAVLSGCRYGVDVGKLEKECLEGNVRSCVSAGAAYETNTFVHRDVVKAAKYFGIAANKGDPQAQIFYSEYFRSGEGVGKTDLREAYAWMLAAARKNFADAGKRAEVLKSKLTPVELDEAERRSAELP